MRRSRGEGSLYRRKDGLWVARYEAAGKRKYLYGRIKKAVTDRLRERLSGGMVDLAHEADTMLVGDCLGRWLPTVRGFVKERTWARHEEVVRLHLKPSIGALKLAKLNAGRPRSCTSRSSARGSRPAPSRSSTRPFTRPQAGRVVVAGPEERRAEAVTPPKPQKKEVRVLSPEEVKRLLRAARGERFEALYVLAATTGMRQGELLGLKWDDLDLKEGIVRVRRTVWEGVATTPKAKASRSIRLTEMARKALIEHPGRGGAGEWVFSSRNGTPVSWHNLINRSWRPLLKKAGLPRIPFHNLRHTCATLLLSKGVHPKLVQELLGHADIPTTLNTYSHVIPSLRGETASAWRMCWRKDQRRNGSGGLFFGSLLWHCC